VGHGGWRANLKRIQSFDERFWGACFPPGSKVFSSGGLVVSRASQGESQPCEDGILMRFAMSETQSVFPVYELDTISFECPECHTEVIFRADEGPDGGRPKHCPSCNREIPHAGHLLSQYRGFYTQSKAFNSLIRLRGPKKVA
jgi:predicted RNA-binding Zn-ribbon protein involved in translation (DUF1610 family)